MVEVIGKRSAQVANKAAELLNDTDVQTSLIGAAIAGVTAITLSGAATREQIRDVFDDIVDMSLFTPVGNAISALIPNGAIQGTMIASSLLAGLGIGEKITNVVLSDDKFDETGHLKKEYQFMVTAAAALISGACVYLASKIPDLLSGEKKLFDLGGFNLRNHLDDADTITGILIKAIMAYAAATAVYAYYGRLVVADANSDGKCTQQEYEAWVESLSGISGILKPGVTFFKPFVSAVPGFDLPGEGA